MSDNESQIPKYSVHDFMIDFLGGLVPGSLFLVGVCVAILPAIYLLFCSLTDTKIVSITIYINDVLKTTQDTPNMIWVLAFALFVAISYELGHLFFRRDPKIPDVESFQKLKKKAEKSFSDDTLTDRLKSEYGCTDEKNCQFPYVYLRDYLGKRGHCHLCPFVVWGNSEEDFNRSKTFINLLKIRLKYYRPEQCSIIIRNEAHIRLATSSWYVAQSLKICSIVGIFLVSLSIALNIFASGASASIKLYLAFFIPAIFVFFTSIFIITRVEDFLHYQRLREVFYVLETAFTAFRDEKYLLNPPFDKFGTDIKKTTCEEISCCGHPRHLKKIAIVKEPS